MQFLKRLLVVMLVWGGFASAQVPVSIGPWPYLQFLDNSGKPLAGGRVFTYNAGTTTLANTYVDSSGTTLNLDPIPLDSAGVASNASGVETGIWLANQSYKFCIQNSLGVQLRCIDNIPGYAFGLLNLANTWTATQTFTQPIIITPSDNQIVLGTAPNQTTIDAPPPVGNITLHLPNTGDTLVGRNTTDTLTNKTLTSPILNLPNVNGTVVVNSPGTYAAIANANPTGTTVSTLTKLINSTAQATIAATTDTSGVIGITVSGAGNSGTAIVQESGLANCVFDGATTAGDYVQISQSVGGDCHDTGSATYPLKGQIVGRVMTTNGGAGTYQVLIFSPDIEGSSANSIGITVANNGATGTSINTLTKLTGAPSTAVLASTSDVGGIIGITTAGAGTTGSAVIAQIGLISCQFDAATTAGDYVQISTITNGDCHDAGASLPSGGQLIGRVLSTNVAAGAYVIDLFPPELRLPPTIIASSTTTNTGVAVGAGNTVLITKAITFPATGCPCRVRLSYAIFFTATASGIASFWASDGTNTFAPSQALTNTAGGGNNSMSGNGAADSPVTYANNAAITFTVNGNTNSAGGITTGSSSLGATQASNLVISIETSN